MDRSAEVLRFLQERGIPHTLHHHEPKWTIESCLTTPGMDGEKATMPRNLFLSNRQGTALYLLLLVPLRPFRTAVVSKLLHVSRLSFGDETLLPELLGLEKGAVSPLGLMFDGDRRVSLAMDAALLSFERLWFHPCVNTQSVEMDTQDFLRRFLPGIGRACRIITIEE